MAPALMGKGARNREARRIAAQATIGKPAETTKSVARTLKKAARRGR